MKWLALGKRLIAHDVVGLGLPVPALCALGMAMHGCASDDDQAASIEMPEQSIDADDGTDEAPTDEPAAGAGASDDGVAWQTLLTGDWTLPAGTEDYVCVRQMVEEDVYVRAFDSLNPPGTHHTFLTMGEPSGPDGIAPCEATENHERMVFGAGVGTEAMVFPDGVAVKVEGGTQLLLNLHLFNATEEEISGTSAVRMQPIDADEVEHMGQTLTAGAIQIELPPMQEYTKAGTCTLMEDTTIFGVVPHMHQLGIHMKVVAKSSVDGERVLHDGPYDFDLQLYYPVEPIQLQAGDQVAFECSWMNDTDRVVGFGDSSLDEMCFVGLFRYPASDAGTCLR